MTSSHPTPSSLQNNISSTITVGTDRLVALIEEENSRVEARNREQMDNLQKCFDQYRQEASETQERLNDRIRALEAQLATKGPGGEEHMGSALGQLDDTCDSETINIIKELVRLVKSGNSNWKHPGQDSLTWAQEHLPKEFIPTFAQYLILKKKGVERMKEKQRGLEKERDSLKEKLVMLSQKLQPSNNNSLAASDAVQTTSSNNSIPQDQAERDTGMDGTYDTRLFGCDILNTA
ncbi:hypothetical protein H0H92_008289 [Tricholoma furcatifolium]|nr:hypothetical protein H0H92_008289 [Tricholoma furcatifolium]